MTALDLPMQSGVEHPQIPGNGAYSRDQEMSVETMRSTPRASIMDALCTIPARPLEAQPARYQGSRHRPGSPDGCARVHGAHDIRAKRPFSSISFVGKMLQARSCSQPRLPTRLPSWIARRASSVRVTPPATSCRHGGSTMIQTIRTSPVRPGAVPYLVVLRATGADAA